MYYPLCLVVPHFLLENATFSIISHNFFPENDNWLQFDLSALKVIFHKYEVFLG